MDERYSISMLYEIDSDGSPEDNFERLIQVGTGLQRARELLIEKYSVDCAITLKDRRYIRVNIKEEQSGQLEHIVQDFFAVAGTPAIIPGLPRLNMMKNILDNYGKKLQGHRVIDQLGNSLV